MEGPVCIDSDEEDAAAHPAPSSSASQLRAAAPPPKRVRVPQVRAGLAQIHGSIDIEDDEPAKEEARALCVGAAVKIHSLANAKELNGIHGVCESFDTAKGRWIVLLQHGDRKSLKPDNLELQAKPEKKEAPAKPDKAEPKAPVSRKRGRFSADPFTSVTMESQIMQEGSSDKVKAKSSMSQPLGKDQALKNGHGSTMPSSKLDEGCAEADSDNDGTTALAGRRTCPRAHTLRKDASSRHNCDGCYRTCIEPPEYVYRCDECDFDLCRECYVSKDSEEQRALERQKRKALWGKSGESLPDAGEKLSWNGWEKSRFESTEQKGKFLRLMGGDKLVEAAQKSCDEEIPTDGDLPTFELSEGAWVEDLTHGGSGRCKFVQDLTYDGVAAQDEELEKLFCQGLQQKDKRCRGLGS